MKKTYQFNNLTVNYPNGETRQRAVMHTEVPEIRREISSKANHGRVYSKDRSIAGIQRKTNEFMRRSEEISLSHHIIQKKILKLLSWVIVLIIVFEILMVAYFS